VQCDWYIFLVDGIGRGVPSPVAVPGGRLSPTEGFLTPRLRDSPSPGPFLSDDEEFESVSQVTGPVSASYIFLKYS
jgi:hypothetical protein